jgi:S1-C subfamily serine protease
MEQPKKAHRWLWLLLPAALGVGIALHYLDFPHVDVDKGKGHFSVTIGNAPESWKMPPLPQNEPAESCTPDIADALQDAAPSLVTVESDGGTELGVVLSENGYIITDADAVKEGVTVRLSDGREFAAESVCTDADGDLAVIKIDAEDLTPARFDGAEPLPEGSDLGKLGIMVSDLPQRTNLFFHLPEGAYVVSVEQDSDLFGRLQPGDIITALDGDAVRDSETLQKALEHRSAEETVTVTVYRRGEARTETAKLMKKNET